MDNQELRSQLQHLREQIRSTPALDEKGSQLLRDLDGDIHDLLERSEEHPVDPQPSFKDRLEQALYHFEVEHPDLTMAVSKVMDTLSNAGI